VNLDLFSRQDLTGRTLGRVASLSVSQGGVPKMGVNGVQVASDRLISDAQNDTKHHGGPDRAVCIYSLEIIQALQAEGHPIDIGTAGENVTVEGLDWNLVQPGARLEIGRSVVLEVTSFTVPCKKIRGSFFGENYVRISEKLHPGWSRVYARVLSTGPIQRGDLVRLLSTWPA
jgi:MOSC domain-containing protein YiiM